MDIHKQIRILLLRHDCLILPGFGGFVAEHYPAQRDGRKFLPPGKKIGFNRRLQTQDGLLTAHLAETYQCSYEDAEKDLKQYILQLQKKIRRNGLAILPGIGKFTLSATDNLRFEPEFDNGSHLAYFGLKSITAYPVIRRKSEELTTAFADSNAENQKEKPIQEVAVEQLEKSEKDPEPVRITDPKKQVKKRSVFFKAAAILLLMTVIGQSVYFGNAPEWAGIQNLGIGVGPLLPVNINTPAIKAPTLNFEINYIQTPELKPADVTPVTEISGSQTKGYYVVIGSFVNEQNAQKWISRNLIENAVVLPPDKGRYRVGIFAGQGYTRGVDVLREVRISVEPQAWLLKSI